MSSKEMAVAAIEAATGRRPVYISSVKICGDRVISARTSADLSPYAAVLVRRDGSLSDVELLTVGPAIPPKRTL